MFVSVPTGEQKAALGGMCCGGPRHTGRGRTLVPTRQGRQGTAQSHCASALLPLFQHVFMPLHRLTVAHLYPAVLLYSREFML